MMGSLEDVQLSRLFDGESTQDVRRRETVEGPVSSGLRTGPRMDRYREPDLGVASPSVLSIAKSPWTKSNLRSPRLEA